jgi:hypothetical protein
MKESFYIKVLKEDRNYIKVHKPKNHNKNTDAFNDAELVGGGHKGFKGTCTNVMWRTARCVD